MEQIFDLLTSQTTQSNSSKSKKLIFTEQLVRLCYIVTRRTFTNSICLILVNTNTVQFIVIFITLTKSGL